MILHLMLRINFFHHLPDIIWGLGIEKEHKMFKTEPLRIYIVTFSEINRIILQTSVDIRILN